MNDCAVFIPQLCLPAPNRKKRWIPVLLLVLMFVIGTVLFFLVPLDSVSSAEAEIAPSSSALFQKECFILEDGVLYFDQSKYAESPILVVPAAIDGQNVSVIGHGCFQDVTGVTTIILPSSITRISDFAFDGCVDLRGIRLPERVGVIGVDAFRGCTSLEAIYIPTGLSQIGSGAFEGCPALHYIFYNGFYEEWISIYPEVITPFTWASCWDGDYCHAGKYQ